MSKSAKKVTAKRTKITKNPSAPKKKQETSKKQGDTPSVRLNKLERTERKYKILPEFVNDLATLQEYTKGEYAFPEEALTAQDVLKKVDAL